MRVNFKILLICMWPKCTKMRVKFQVRVKLKGGLNLRGYGIYCNQILIRKIQRKWRKIFKVIDHNNWPLLETKKFHSVMIIYDDDIQMIWRLFCNLFVKKVNLISEISKFHNFVYLSREPCIYEYQSPSLKKWQKMSVAKKIFTSSN